jgi:hypothetical protein
MEDITNLKGNFNFSCVLNGDIQHLQKIKERIIQEYIRKGLVKLSNPIYEKGDIYILTGDQWEEYQKLKEYRKQNLIGAGFP